ncbi:hypothetical protein P879_03842 [Paragonimus westermani]|uniref:DUF4550 domain-containing protein n=1 Tax=Paragonimus westermani TaxID=34504 RepID=A0A8T0DDK2_9TREM|nr:hypothetical protein P879_03842 [Paragonimus westermani]
MSRIQRPFSTSSELLVIKRTLTSSPNSRSNRNTNEPIVEHSTILKFTFAIAVSCDSLLIVDTSKKSALKKTAKRDVVVKDSPQFSPCYFHLEYTADTRDYLLATDVVVFTLSLAKVYPAGLASKTVSPWIDGDTLWIAWEEQVPLECSDENIMDIWRRNNNGGARICIWDNKENCSVQTRFDRPRSITPNSCDARGVEIAVRNVVKFCDKAVDISPDDGFNKIACKGSKKKMDEDQETLPNCITSKRTCVEDTEGYHLDNLFKSDRSVGSSKSVTTHRFKTNRARFAESPIKGRIRGDFESGNKHALFTSSSSSSRTTRSNNLKQAATENTGSCRLVLNVAHLFRCNPPPMITAYKPKTVTNESSTTRTESQLFVSETTFTEFLVGLQTTGPLLSQQQREHFKPLAICVNRLRGLPYHPYRNYEDMRAKCDPLEMKWSFGDIFQYKTRQYWQDNDIRMADVQVILLGAYSNEKISELFQGTPIIMDLYDRTPRSASSVEVKTEQSTGTLFGTEPNDSRFNVMQSTMEVPPQLVNSHVPPECFTVDKHPFGRVIIPVDELLTLNRNILKGRYPVLPISETALDLSIMLRTSSENPRKAKREYVGYLEADCSLFVSIELNFLVKKLEQLSLKHTAESETFERIVCILEISWSKEQKAQTDPSLSTTKVMVRGCSTSCPQFVKTIKKVILQINADCLNVSTARLPDELETSFITLKADKMLSFNESPVDGASTVCKTKHSTLSSASLITGFHLSDPSFHAFVLEFGSYSDTATRLRRLFNSLSDQFDDRFIKILQNSDLKFTSRLYADQPLSFPEISLLVPVTGLVQQPLFHVRDLLPRQAYIGINRLHTIRTISRSLMEVTHADLLPTSGMLNALTKEFAVPPILSAHLSRASTVSGHADLQRDFEETADNPVAYQSNQKRKDAPVPKLTAVKRPWRDFVGKRRRPSASSVTRRQDSNSMYRSVTCTQTATYNYSIQKLNSAIMARNELIGKLLTPNNTFTYSPRFLHSGSFENSNESIDFASTLRDYVTHHKPSSAVNEGDRVKRNLPNWNFSGSMTCGWTQRVGFKAHLARNEHAKKHLP